MRILVVDDTDDTRVAFKSILESLGHEVFEAENGRRAIEISVQKKPDLVLMDLHAYR